MIIHTESFLKTVFIFSKYNLLILWIYSDVVELPAWYKLHFYNGFQNLEIHLNWIGSISIFTHIYQ